jgi:hypothetical protein
MWMVTWQVEQNGEIAPARKVLDTKAAAKVFARTVTSVLGDPPVLQRVGYNGREWVAMED